jgi:hypothetical protein
MEHVLKEASVGIRVPATANLMVDSFDRDEARYPTPWEFQIQRNSSILNGFFNRIGVSEQVLEWRFPNINALAENDFLLLTVTGVGQESINLPEGMYTVAEVLDLLVVEAGVAFPGRTFSIVQTPTGVNFEVDAGATITVDDCHLAQMLGMNTTAPASRDIPIAFNRANLQLIRYLDFLSPQLTYNQDLKDAATQNKDLNVLSRWYMSYDNPVANDAYNFPVLMGYEPFNLRRIFNPPKQIKWDKIQPLGNLAFEVYAATYFGGYGPMREVDPNYQVSPASDSQWLITLQVSEN